MKDNPSRLAWIALLILVPLPSLGTLMAMVIPATQGTPLGQGVYAFSKVWVLILPLLWLRFVDKGSWSFSAVRQGGLGVGLAWGIAIAVSIIGVYFMFGDQLIDVAHLRSQATANGLTSPAIYIGLFAYLSLVNALLEEYVWRWFVYRKSELIWGSKAAVPLTALFFTLHHIIALKVQFGWAVTLLGSFGVFAGSLIWSWCYRRYQSIWPGYVSHVLADLAIAVVGYLLLFPSNTL